MDGGAKSNSFQFRGIDFMVCMCHDEENNITVEVEDKTSADQWRGTFDASYIEDLTHKTGNFKQFQIFVSMLESAIAQSSDSVSLDLLTYADLEALRSRKAGVGTKSNPPARSTNLNSKRYLILTYTVEFDRIHYPLPLPYMGKPDPRALQDTIRQLREENKRLQQHGSKDFKHKELEKLNRDYDSLLQEKEDLEADFIDFKRQVENTTKGAAAKEIRVLKNMVKHLEQELVTERTKQQRKVSKLNQDYRQAFHELEELRSSERNLRVRVKSLTNELNVYKRGRTPTRSSANNSASSRNSASGVFRSSLVRDRSSSRENSLNRNTGGGGGGRFSRDSSLTRHGGRGSRDNSLTRNSSRLSRDASRLSAASRDSSLTRPRTLNSARERSLSRDRPAAGGRQRSLSREKPSGPSGGNFRGRTFMRDTASSRGRSDSRDRSFNSVGSRHRSPSPGGVPRSPRFDPTAFIKEKERKRKEAEQKLKRQNRGVRNNPRPKRPSSVSSLRSRSSSIDSLSDIGLDTDASESRRLNRVIKSSRSPPSSAMSSPDSVSGRPALQKTNKILASTPEAAKYKAKSRTVGKENRTENGGAFYDRTEEISEIDERLNRLQQFMKQNLQ